MNHFPSLSSFARCLLLLATGTAVFACSKEVESPQPELAPPSAAAEPPPVDPEIVCRDQAATEVTLHGASFTPIPIDLPGDPKVALPTVSLSRGHELAGGKVGDPDQVVYSGEPDADPSNAFDGEGKLILVGGKPLLRWKSREEMSFLVTQELTLGAKPEGDDTRKRGMLPPGLWDVQVRNPEGKSAESLGSLAVVDKPELKQLSPAVVCLEQGPRTLALEGTTLLRNGADAVQLAIDGVDERVALELEDCVEIAHDGLDAELCTSARATLAKGSVPVGYPALTLENPETAACKSEEEVSLRVVPAPRVERMVEALACIAQGARTFAIEGRDFLRIDDTRVPTVTVGDKPFDVESMDCGAALPAGEHMVEPCTSITISIAPGELEPGLYAVTVVNPDNLDYPDNDDPPGCSSTLADAVRIVPPPSIDELEPSYVCLQDGGREVSLHGSDFLVVDGVLPAITVDGEALAANAIKATNCDSAGLDVGERDVERCSTLVLSLAKDGVDPGNPVIAVTNPTPAGCNDQAMDAWTVLPRPTLELAAPQPICNQQGDDVITLTGSGFLDLAGAVPAVTIGGVAATGVDATDASCTAVAGRTGAALCTELVVTLPAGSLAAGLHDVVVVNTDPAGCTTEDDVSLAVVNAPTVASVAPNPICLEQGAVEVTITGTSFVRLGTLQPAVSVGGVVASNVAVTAGTCTAVAGTSDAVTCTEIKATLAMSALAVDTSNRVVITNPGSASCTSQEAIDLQVVPPPDVAAIASADVCTGGGAVTITGSHLAGVTARLVDPDTQGVINALSTVVNAGGTQATITFGSGVQPDTYELVISSTSGCNDTAAQNVVATLGPVAFFVDPPVAYNGVALRATVYASGVTAVPANVVLTPQGSTNAADQKLLTNVAWPAGSNNKIGATIPTGLPEGTYDVTLDFAAGCDAVLASGLKIEADTTLALTTPALHPQFGEQNSSVAVDVGAKATADLAQGQVNFQATPRAYLSSSALATAEPLRAVAFDSVERLTAIVPDTLAAGSYDLVVVNPDGSVGFQAGAYEATAVAPPVIDDVTPTQIPSDVSAQITIAGGNFFNPTTDMAVTLECRAPGATSSTAVGPLVIGGASTTTSLIATVPMGIANGASCVVRVTNTSNDTFDEFSALTTTNPAAKLVGAFRAGPSLIDARRAPASVIGRATRQARFVYAIGGDDGNAQNAKSSVEAAQLGRFGELSAFRTLATALPAGVTQAQAVTGGRYVYLFGGLVANATSAQILRAQVLDPSAAPEISGVDLRFFSTPDADPATRDGLEPGAWTYVISAVFAAGDSDNPSGESLPSEPLTLYAPNVPDGVEVQLDWPAVLGTGAVEAVKYRIYRTTAANGALGSLRLLAEVNAPTHSFVDKDMALLDAQRAPLAIGDLGAWRTMPGAVSTARAAYGLAVATALNGASCDHYVYLLGGRAAAATESASYDYATFDPQTGALGAFTQVAAAAGLTARRELATFVADDASSTQVSGCTSHVYAAHGHTGAAGFVTSVQEATVLATGVLGAFTDSGPSNKNLAGHAGFFSSDHAFVLGGASNAAAAIDDADLANMCTGGGCTAPDLQNFTDATQALLQARYLPGFARQSPFLYLVGGADANGAALSSSEFNVR